MRGKLEREAPSEVDAEVFLEELGKPAFETELDEVDGSVAAALLRTWWRGRVPDPDGWWTQSVLDSGDAFWWRESETAEGGMEVRLNDPRNASSEAEGGGAGDGSAWTSGMLESGAPARSKWPLGSARARLVRLLGARLAALASSALPGRGPATGLPAAASAASAALEPAASKVAFSLPPLTIQVHPSGGASATRSPMA